MQYVAVKILTAHATQAQRQLANELGLLRRVQNLAEKSRNPGRDHVVNLIDSFEVSSSRGSHLCLVHQALGRFSMINSRGLPIPLVKILAKQLLLALDFLHRECNVVHTGACP
jgi:serine/threonine-protein kinase SRPK3